MEGLQKTPTGKYRGRDVDKLIQQIRSDYEECLKEQKQRILELREENKKLAAFVEKYRKEAQYVSDAIAQAEQTARKIIERAELEAMNRLADAETKSHQMQMEARACVQRLLKLREASESVYMAVCKALPDNDTAAEVSARTVAQAVMNLCETGR